MMHIKVTLKKTKQISIQILKIKDSITYDSYCHKPNNYVEILEDLKNHCC